MALATFLHLLRSHSIEDERLERQYRTQVGSVATQVHAVFDDWMALREIEPDYGRLANAAAVNRWELMKLAAQVERLVPSRALGHVQRDMHAALLKAARACQLLANGYRFHKSGAVCDGQALLLETLETLDGLAREF